MAGQRDRSGVRVTIDAAAGPVWLSTWCEALGIDPDRQAGPTALWARIASPCAFALVTDGELPLGVAMAVRDGSHVGIFNMATLPQARRRGVARSALGALAAWGAEGGATRVYLQVDAANQAARALYERGGLRAAYEYVYLVGPAAGARVAGAP